MSQVRSSSGSRVYSNVVETCMAGAMARWAAMWSSAWTLREARERLAGAEGAAGAEAGGEVLSPILKLMMQWQWC